MRSAFLVSTTTTCSRARHASRAQQGSTGSAGMVPISARASPAPPVVPMKTATVQRLVLSAALAHTVRRERQSALTVQIRDCTMTTVIHRLLARLQIFAYRVARPGSTTTTAMKTRTVLLVILVSILLEVSALKHGVFVALRASQTMIQTGLQNVSAA